MSMPPSAMSIGPLMREIENNDYYLPAIQREFVWPPHKIEALFDSLLRGYPIGTMLRWKVSEIVYILWSLRALNRYTAP